jgi:hypothetical protein
LVLVDKLGSIASPASLFSSGASATTGAATARAVIPTGTNNGLACCASTGAFFSCCFHCQVFLIVNKLIEQNYSDKERVLLQFGGRDLYNSRWLKNPFQPLNGNGIKPGAGNRIFSNVVLPGIEKCFYKRHVRCIVKRTTRLKASSISMYLAA